MFRVLYITRIIVHLTSEEAARAESGNFLLVNPSDDTHSKKTNITKFECAIAAKSLRPNKREKVA